MTFPCAQCGKQLTEASPFIEVFLRDPENEPVRTLLCSLYCLGWWAQREEGFRRARAQGWVEIP